MLQLPLRLYIQRLCSRSVLEHLLVGSARCTTESKLLQSFGLAHPGQCTLRVCRSGGYKGFQGFLDP